MGGALVIYGYIFPLLPIEEGGHGPIQFNLVVMTVLRRSAASGVSSGREKATLGV